MDVLNLTTGAVYATLSAAIAASHAGDRIGLPPGRYVENFPIITHSLQIEGMGGFARLATPGAPANGRAILYVANQAGADLSVRRLELSGAASANGNAAGILFESGNGRLSVEACWIHDNQEGVLVGAGAASSVVIAGSELDHNGVPPEGLLYGRTHNVYVGAIRRFEISFSYVHDALGGHEIKSRARETVIRRNRIEDGPSADSSYSVDLPDGGRAEIRDNVIEQGASATNEHAIHFGGERQPSYVGSGLVVTGNVMINDLARGGVAVFNDSRAPGGQRYGVVMTGNSFYGFPQLYRASPAPLADGRPYERIGPNLRRQGAAPALDTRHPWDTGPPG